MALQPGEKYLVANIRIALFKDDKGNWKGKLSNGEMTVETKEKQPPKQEAIAKMENI